VTHGNVRRAGKGTGGCTGGIAKPTAPKGILCVYTASEEYENVIGEQLNANLRPAIVEEGYGSSGAFLAGFGGFEPSSFAEGRGTWAVTAP
jgi:hypothetical protein